MKNKLRNATLLLISMMLIIVSVYATVTIANDKKSNKLPWQGTLTGYYDSAHNVGVSNVADIRFNLLSGTIGNGGGGVILDSTTGLYWMSDGNIVGIINRDNAKDYCYNLILGGHNKWRLPNKKELLSIIDLTRFNPSINTNFFSSSSSLYWSSTNNLEFTNSIWAVHYHNGNSISNSKTINNYARCVE